MFKLFKVKRKEKNQLKFLREESGMTPKQLAKSVEDLHQNKIQKKLHVSWQTIVAIENYRYEPTFGLSVLIAEVLGKDVNQVFFNSYKKEHS